MFRFIASVVLGFGCTVYGTAFGVLSLTQPFYLLPGQPIYAIALLVLGLATPVFGFYLATESSK